MGRARLKLASNSEGRAASCATSPVPRIANIAAPKARKGNGLCVVRASIAYVDDLFFAHLQGSGVPGEITIIDFPQVVNLHNNRKAHFILSRDIQRVCEYFARQEVSCKPQAIMKDLWARHVQQPDPQDVAADQSRIEQMLSEAVAEAEVIG